MQLGQVFDDYMFSAIKNNFGPWFDADRDGKVALMCYDIDYKTVIGGGYIGGYFAGGDIYGASLDAIHIDTNQGMRQGTDVTNCYGTVVHEFQHLVNFSYIITKDRDLYDPTFLNEAFSEAATHLYEGPQASRMRDYSGIGTSIAEWQGYLADYSMAYLFGQYLRVHYGSDIYRRAMEGAQKKTTSYKALLEIIGIPDHELCTNFYAALAVNESTGPYGFMGDPNFNEIPPPELYKQDTVYLGPLRGIMVSLRGTSFTPEPDLPDYIDLWPLVSQDPYRRQESRCSPLW